MTTISVRFVRQPRTPRYCAECRQIITGPGIRLYGMAEYEQPWTLWLHATPQCCPNLNGDTKVATALEAAMETAP